MTGNPIYLDNSTAARPSEKAISGMQPIYQKFWGAASAPHGKGLELTSLITEAYQGLYTFLGAKPRDTIILTSSGAEAVNHAIYSSYCDITLNTGKNQFLCSSTDEAPAIMSMGRLERFGNVCRLLPAGPKGYVEAKTFADYVNPRTALLTLSWANGLTGVIQPLNEIASICFERGIRLHLDATHVLGKLYFELEDTGADLISFNGAQLHAPQGTGALFIKEGIKIPPFIVGGLDQAGQRAGTLDLAKLTALHIAVKEAAEARDLLCTETARLRNRLETLVTNGFPDAKILFQESERLPNCSAIAFPGIANEALLYSLNRKQVYASIGGGNFQQISFVLEACGTPRSLAACAVSFSLSRETTEAEIERAAEIIVENAIKLRKTSSYLIPT